MHILSAPELDRIQVTDCNIMIGDITMDKKNGKQHTTNHKQRTTNQEQQAESKRVPRSPFFWFKCLSAGGVGTLPAEAVPKACKKQGATIAIFLI